MSSAFETKIYEANIRKLRDSKFQKLSKVSRNKLWTIIASINITLYLTSILSMLLTYDLNFTVFMGVFVLTSFYFVGVYVMLCFVYLFYLLYVYIKKSNVLFSFCYFINTISFCFGCIKIWFWLLIATSFYVSYHPYWKGEFEDIFLDKSDENGKTLRPYFQTTQYSGKIKKPKDVSEIISIVNDGITNNRNIRAIGSGHSSNPLYSDDIMVSLEHFNSITVDTVNETVLVGAGVVLGELEDTLYDLGYVLLGFGSAQKQRMGGMLGTGVYGAFGSMSKNAIEIWLVDGNGNNVYINEFNVTNNITLINAARVNIGLLGIIYQIRFTIEKTFVVRKSGKDLTKTIKKEYSQKFSNINDSTFYNLLLGNDTITNNTSNNDIFIGSKLFVSLGKSFDVIYETFSKVLDNTTYKSKDVTVNYNTNNILRDTYVNYGIIFTCALPSRIDTVTSLGFGFQIDEEKDKFFAVKSALRTDEYFHGGYIYYVPFHHCRNTIDEIIQLSNKLRKSSRNIYSIQMTIIALHQNEDNGYLSYIYDNDACLIEIYPNVCDNWRKRLALLIEDIIYTKYNGSSHWGKQFLNEQKFYESRNSWSHFNEFNEIRQAFDPNNIFMTDYLYNIFLHNTTNKLIKINYPLMNFYAKNSGAWKVFGWFSFIIPGFVVTMYGILVLWNIIPDYATHKVSKTYWIWLFCVFCCEAIIAIIVYFSVRESVNFDK